MDHIFSAKNRPYISSRLKMRSLMFLCLAAVMISIMGYDVATGTVAWWIGLIGIAAGFVIGFVFGRLACVRWHESEEKIVTQNDATSIIIILVYIGLSMLREMLLRDLLSGAALLATSFAVAAGVLFGRFIGMHISIMRVLKERRA